MNKLIRWERGLVLKTNVTREWTDEKLNDEQRYESEIIYSNFHQIDEGRTRELVCILNTSHPNFEGNRILIEKVPEMLYMIESMSVELDKLRGLLIMLNIK